MQRFQKKTCCCHVGKMQGESGTWVELLIKNQLKVHLSFVRTLLHFASLMHTSTIVTGFVFPSPKKDTLMHTHVFLSTNTDASDEL